jgi:hypothetical protein
MRSFVLIALLAGCIDRHVTDLPPLAEPVVVKNIPLDAEMDILLVVDNSASTADKQKNFKDNFDKLVTVLDSFPGGRPNLHIAVVDTTVDIGVPGFGGCPSPDPQDDGLMQTGNCGIAGRFVIDEASASGRNVNYNGLLKDAVTCAASVGSTGCGFEAPLEAMKRAFARPENTGFLRPGATLAIVFLTDEDDASTKDSSVFSLAGSSDDFRVQPLYAYACDQTISASAPGTYTGCKPRTDSYLTDPASYVQFLSTIKDPSQTVIAVIASPPPGFATDDAPAQHANINTDAIVTGPLTLNGHTQPLALQPSTTCTIDGGAAIGRPALRLAGFARNYASDHARFYNVCQPDYSEALVDIGNNIIKTTDPCIEGNVLEPLQCSVMDVQGDAQQLIPACGTGATPCWHADPTPRCAYTPSGLELVIDRASAPPAGTVINVQCAVGPP